MTEERKGKQKAQTPCHCPYCDVELETPLFPFCGACGQQLQFCPECGEATPRDASVCSHCGAEQKRRS